MIHIPSSFFQSHKSIQPDITDRQSLRQFSHHSVTSQSQVKFRVKKEIKRLHGVAASLHSASASWSRQIFVIGRSKQLLFVLIRTWRTNPFLSGNVCRTFPIIQEFRGAVWSTISTISPGIMFRFTRDHL